MSLTLRLVLFFCLYTNLNAKPLISGNGSISYHNTNKETLPQNIIYRTNHLTGPVPTNDWWSSILWEKFSSNHFPHPFALDYDKQGLRIFYPGSSINTFEKGLAAGMPELTQDIIIAASTKKLFKEARVHDFSDWFITTHLGDENNFLRLTYGHGSPFIFANFQNISPSILFTSNPTIWSKSTNTIGLTTDKGNHYGLFIPKRYKWDELQSKKINASGPKSGFFSLALLPNNDQSTLKYFGNFAHNHVVNTHINWSFKNSDSSVVTEFKFETKAVCSSALSNNKTLSALYPHQWRRSKNPTTKYHYQSVRGKMKLIDGNSFKINYEFPGVLPSLPLEVKNLKEDLQNILNSKNLAKDTYWSGKALGNLASASSIAEVCNHDSISESIRTKIKSELKDWFSYSKLKGDKHFYYDENWSTLTGIPPSYGSAKEINDHHFHYGYFLRAASEIARFEPEWLKEKNWGSIINLIIQDIANTDRQNKHFPFLRNFDPYAGHSWASGHARFADGNNQESSSESMNAWTGLILLGQFTNNTRLRDLGIFLYSSELAAIEEYWFDINKENHPEKIKSPSLAMIWGGKSTYETWFSDAPHCKTGINILPIHGGSLYLGRFPNFVKENYEFSLNNSNGKWAGWPSIMMSYEALYDAENSWKKWNEYGKKMPLDSGNTKANTIHWIENLRRLGQLQKDIKCDYPISATFKSDTGTITHAVYLNGAKSLRVNFSNGASFDALPGKFTIKTVN